MSRIYLAQAREEGDTVALEDAAFRHVARVLRMRVGDRLTVFNGQGSEFAARITQMERHAAHVQLEARREANTESPLHSSLLQAVGKGERMDWALQKATELGISAIQPVLTARCNVKLDAERWAKKQAHWQGVLIAACEQSGRLRIPELRPVAKLDDILDACTATLRLVLAPQSGRAPIEAVSTVDSVALLVGPEGGLNDEEIRRAEASGFQSWQIGPRTLRTETAPMVALALLQQRFGDYGPPSDSGSATVRQRN
ncbi:16S rRNA (uracil(1498)-N(3))-methyltransferase [Algiphilus sp.]|uniref:16S rRNA (uracil(1498)-N(3))-methyltransferase n=1 Tax=Algiphilus sp. TaxID=1872431 RepID=UPI003B52FCA7